MWIRTSNSVIKTFVASLLLHWDVTRTLHKVLLALWFWKHFYTSKRTQYQTAMWQWYAIGIPASLIISLQYFLFMKQIRMIYVFLLSLLCFEVGLTLTCPCNNVSHKERQLHPITSPLKTLFSKVFFMGARNQGHPWSQTWGQLLKGSRPLGTSHERWKEVDEAGHEGPTGPRYWQGSLPSPWRWFLPWCVYCQRSA